MAELARALREAEQKSIAERFAAALLEAIYPDWFKKHYRLMKHLENPPGRPGRPPKKKP